MNSDLNLYVIALVIALVLLQTLFHFRKSTRNLIFSQASKATTWTLKRFNRLLHTMLMSPVKTRPDVTKGNQK